MSRIGHFELTTDDLGHVVKTYKVQLARISMIKLGVYEFDFNESFDILTEHLEMEMNGDIFHKRV